VGVEMTKKQMAIKIAELEKRVSELTDALVTLAGKPFVSPGYVFIPSPRDPIMIPYTPPLQPTWPPYPQVGDPVYPYNPTITCNVDQSKQSDFVIN
jgi:hypothetical protein